MDQTPKPPRPPNPKENANILSFLTFFYTLDIFKKGSKKELEQEDLYEVLKCCKSKTLGDLLEIQWEKDRKKFKKPSLLRTLCMCFGKTYLFLGVLQLTMRTIQILLIPDALAKLVSFFSPHQTTISLSDAYYYAGIVVGLTAINVVYSQNYMMALTELGIRIRTSICSFVYRKSLKMSDKSLSEISIGKVLTLITKDVMAIELLIIFANDVWIGIIQTGIICYLIYGKIGIAAFVGVGFFLIVLPIQIIIGKLSTSFRLKSSKKTDDRLQLTQEILSTIKIIKMYSWQEFFNDKISNLRKKEVNSIFRLFCLKIVIVLIGALSGKIAFYLLIMSYVWMGNYITAEIVFFIKSCFQKLRHFFTMLVPLGVTFAAEFGATVIRLKSVLYAEEVPTPKGQVPITGRDPLIKLSKISVKIKGNEIFKNVTVDIKNGLNMMTGNVGTGKSSLIRTILEDYKVEGNLTIFGTLSYASQEPWLFPATIKHNILFGENMDVERYKKVLEVCALNHDLNKFPYGDDTLIGDNGVNLSKGQKARVNLARAIYKKADIYLLDDCLAPLDGHVSDFIFHECILKFLKGKLCLLVTNNPDYYKCADWFLRVSSSAITYNENLNKEKFVLQYNKEAEITYKKETTEPPKMQKIYKEEKKKGKVDLEVYRQYLRFGGGYFMFGFIILLYVAAHAVMSYNEKLVSKWVTVEQDLSYYIQQNDTSTEELEETKSERTFILNLYTIIIISSTVLSLIKAFIFFNFNRRASINLHKLLISKIINAKMTFFDSHFIGNVLNRFSKDLGSIDEHLAFIMNDCLEHLFFLAFVIVLIATVNTIFLIPAVIFFVLAYFIRFLYLRTGRSLQRLELASRSPLIGHLNATLEGLTTIRAFKAQEIVKNEFDNHADLYVSANHTLETSLKALSLVLDGMCLLFETIVIMKFLFFFDDTSVGNVGLAITQAFHLTGLLQHSIKRWADLENNMTSVERILEYTEAEQEKDSGKVLETWPQNGEIVFKKVSLILSDRNVLRNITFTIKPKEKIGIVGRTGAGKSSIISTLFRLYDAEGVIQIDGVNTEDLSLHFLRSNIALIPQDPVLISGTIRDNIDPLRQHNDEEIWSILKTCKLHNIRNLSDDVKTTSTFSSGQKQLICLARAIIRGNKIVVLDEATANLDNETDEIVRDVIDKYFSSCTVIIIAHRLSSVMNSNTVVVLDDGQIVEHDDPRKLLQNKESLFAQMIKQM